MSLLEGLPQRRNCAIGWVFWKKKKSVFFCFDCLIAVSQCFLPDDIISTQGCIDTIILVQMEMTISGFFFFFFLSFHLLKQTQQARALSFLDIFFGLSECGVDRALQEVGIRAVCTLVADGELHHELRKLLQDVSRKSRTKMSRPFMSGIAHVLQQGSATHRKAAITLLASLVGRWQHQQAVLTLLFSAAQHDVNDSNRVVAIEAISFLQDEFVKTDYELAASLNPICQRVLCVIVARDGNAEVRNAAVDALFPRHHSETLSSETARAISERVADRSVKTRTRAALCLKAWGNARINTSFQVSDWQVNNKTKTTTKQKRMINPFSNSILQNGACLLCSLPKWWKQSLNWFSIKCRVNKACSGCDDSTCLTNTPFTKPFSERIPPQYFRNFCHITSNKTIVIIIIRKRMLSC
jgi:hypothetical protein